MEGTELKIIQERMSVFGYMKSFENDFYRVSFVYGGDMPKTTDVLKKEGEQIIMTNKKDTNNTMSLT